MTKILAFAGSARRESLNKQLLKVAADLVADEGIEMTRLDMADFPMPLYDGDLEESDGIPAKAAEFYEIVKSHQGLLIACPEYNGSITPLLKNTIDWTSRPREGESPLVAFRGKVAGLVAASPGALGGLRGLVHVRAILGNIGVHVVPNQVAVGRMFEKLDGEGGLNDKPSLGMLQSMAKQLADTVKRLHG